MNQPRRKFLKELTLTGFIAAGYPQINSFAGYSNSGVKQKAKKGMVILFQGDSITDGNRGRNEDPNHIMGHGYASSIASRLGADYPEMQYKFYNRGISGNTIIDLASRWQADTLDLNPDILSILVGVNDSSSVVLHWNPVVSVEKYEEEYNNLLNQTMELFPEIVLVLCEPFILQVGNVAENWEAYHSDIVKRQAVVRNFADQYNTVFVGFQEVFDKACQKAPANYWIWDGVHPTFAGHELMTREWLKEVESKISFNRK
jgi:lysophospholipase L1-like esterase